MDGVRFEQVQYSLAELQSAVADLEAELSQAGVGVSSLWIDPSINRLVLMVADDESSRETVEAIVGDAPVDISYGNAPMVQL